MTKNLPPSVRQRLLNLARRDGRPFQEVMQFFAMERFLYRLASSAHAASFVLKGALMLQVWQAPHSRPTMDIDMLGRIGNDPERLQAVFHEVLSSEPVPDGLVFDAASLTLEPITKDADYQGLRIRFVAWLGTARVRMQVDIGFGDAVHPAPEEQVYPVLLDFPAPRLLCYSRYSAIAEKFQAMVALGRLNSRMKDFFDVWLLSRQFRFEGEPLRQAVEKTFTRRATTLPEGPLFNDVFVREKQPQWQAFHRRLAQHHVPADFAAIAEQLEDFFSGLLGSGSEVRKRVWPAGGPWRHGGSDG